MVRYTCVSFVFVLIVLAGCNSSVPPAVGFEEFSLGMSIGDVDAELGIHKWVKVGAYTYGNTVRYDLQVVDPKPPHLEDVSRVQLISVDETLVSIEVVTSADAFSTLKQTMKSMDEGLVSRYGDPRRERVIDDLQRSQISGSEPLTLSVWHVDPPHRVVAMAIHQEGGQLVGLTHYVDLQKHVQKNKR